jgi:hypothetical protein
MADLIAALVEAIGGIITVMVEAIPVIIEALVYVAMGAITIIAYALSRQFRERKRREWRERPKWKYVDLGISAACLGVLAFLGFWILLPGSNPAPSRKSPAVEQAQHSGEFRLVISRRSEAHSNELQIAVKKGAIAKLLHRKPLHPSGQVPTQSLAAIAGPLDPGTNELQTSAQRSASP